VDDHSVQPSKNAAVGAAARSAAAYVPDKMRNLMKILVQHHKLDSTALMDAWTDWVSVNGWS
jgi:hypothetical protein